MHSQLEFRVLRWTRCKSFLHLCILDGHFALCLIRLLCNPGADVPASMITEPNLFCLTSGDKSENILLCCTWDLSQGIRACKKIGSRFGQDSG